MKELAKTCTQVWEETGHEAVKYTKDTQEKNGISLNIIREVCEVSRGRGRHDKQEEVRCG